MYQHPRIAHVLPGVKSAALDGATAAAALDGVFQRFAAPIPPPPIVNISSEVVRTADQKRHKTIYAMDENAWKYAAAWRLQVPSDLSLQNHVLRIQYQGDVARLYAGGELVSDNFCNGSPFDVALWRIPADRRDSLEIHILPPAQISSITAIPRKQWSVVWEQEAE